MSDDLDLLVDNAVSKGGSAESVIRGGESLGGKSLLKEGARIQKMYDSVEEKKPTSVQVDITDVRVKTPPDFGIAREMLEKKVPLYRVKNDSSLIITMDWFFPLLPADLQVEFKKYLSAKYAQYGLQMSVETQMITSIFYKGQMIDFLANFMNEKRYPTIMSRAIGGEVAIKSSIVILPQEVILVTAEQLKGLEHLEKKKQTAGKDRDGKDTTSDWLGFLIFTQVKSEAGFDGVKRIFISKEDLLRTDLDIQAFERTVDTTAVPQSHDFIRASESDK